MTVLRHVILVGFCSNFCWQSRNKIFFLRPRLPFLAISSSVLLLWKLFSNYFSIGRITFIPNLENCCHGRAPRLLVVLKPPKLPKILSVKLPSGSPHHWNRVGTSHWFLGGGGMARKFFSGKAGIIAMQLIKHLPFPQ